MDSTDLRDFSSRTSLTGLPAWQALTRHLSLASGPDVLFLITPDAYGAKACRSELEKKHPPHTGPLINLEPDVPNDPAELTTRLEAAIDEPAHALYWVELPAEVPYESIPDAQAAWDCAFAALNPHRNHLLQNLPGPLIFAGPSWLFQSFRSHAPDWFSVRAGVFDLPRDIEQELLADMPLYADDGTQLEPTPEVEFPPPEFPPGIQPLSAEELEKLLIGLPLPELALLQTLSWLDAGHPIPVWLLANHPPLPEYAGVPETLDYLIRRGLLVRSLDTRWLRLSPPVMEAVTNTIPELKTSHSSLENAFEMFANAGLGNPSDVRSWPKWNPTLPHAISLCEQALDEPAPQHLTWLLSQLDNFLHAKGLHAEAEKYSRRALRISRAAYGEDHPLVAPRLNNLAQLLQATNHLAEAELLMRDALRIARTAYGDDHPKVGISLSNLARLLKDRNHLAEAEPLMRDALRIDRAVYGDDHPNVARDLNNLAQLLQATNRLAEAEPLMRDVLRITRIAYGDDHPNVGISLNNLAQLLQSTNRLSEAEPLMRDALRIDRAAYGDDHPDVAIDLNNLAALLKATDRLSEAEPLMRNAVRIFRDTLGPEHPNTVTTLENLEILLTEMKNLPPEGEG